MDADTRIEIFRPGTFTSVEGVTVSYSSADLADIAGAYDPALFDAPLVVGHPKLDEPAYGWVDRLEMDGDRLVAVPRDVEPAFSDLVAAKRYKKISAQLYPADHPANPVPGKTYLKHVGFLGAAAPAVKGLKSVSFSEEQVAGTLTIDLPEHKEPNVADPDPDQQTQSFAEVSAEVAALKQQLADRDTRDAAAAKVARHDAALSFAEAQIAAGKLAPAGKALVVGLLEGLDAATAISFGEGEANQLTPAAAFRKLFEGAGMIVSFGELAKRGDEPAGARDGDANDLAAEAMSFADAEQAAGRARPTSTEAVGHIIRKRAAQA
jgi:hypothetical protein